MEEIAARFALLFSGLFVIVDPVGTVPLLLGLTQNYDRSTRLAVIGRASLFAATLLIFFSLVGARALELFHINLNAFRIAGGVLLFLTALEMMKGTPKKLPNETGQENSHHDVSYVPLGMPSLAGPGAITSVIVFSTDHAESHGLHAALLVTAIIMVFGVSYLVLRTAAGTQRFLGTNGLTVLGRVMGLFLAALAVQFVLEGALKLAAELGAS